MYFIRVSLGETWEKVSGVIQHEDRVDERR